MRLERPSLLFQGSDYGYAVMLTGTYGLPIEVWDAIFQEAAALPDDFYGDRVALGKPGRNPSDAWTKPYAMKCTLRLTCRLFRDIVTRRLFEVLILESTKGLDRLVRLLQLASPDGQTFGHSCKVINLHLWQRCIQWTTGRETLWGIFDACPNVVDLRISIVNYRAGSPHMLGGGQYYVPVQFLQKVACTYGPSLKRFELTGTFNVHIRDLERFLSCCPALEHCRLTGLDGRNSRHKSYDITTGPGSNMLYENREDYASVTAGIPGQEAQHYT